MTTPLRIAAALSDESRVRALLSMERGELCVCQIVEMLGLAPSSVSKHLSILRDAGLIQGRKEGRWMHYRLSEPGDEGATPAAMEALAWVRAHMADDRVVAADRRRLDEILKLDPEELCSVQRERTGCCSSARATRAGARWPKGGRGASTKA